MLGFNIRNYTIRSLKGNEEEFPSLIQETGHFQEKNLKGKKLRHTLLVKFQPEAPGWLSWLRNQHLVSPQVMISGKRD